MGYRSINEIFNFLDQQEFESAYACIHDDFMYLREVEMLSLDDFKEHMHEFGSGVLTSANRVTHHDDAYSTTFTHDVTWNKTTSIFQADTKKTVRVTALKKDGLLWRQMITYMH